MKVCITVAVLALCLAQVLSAPVEEEAPSQIEKRNAAPEPVPEGAVLSEDGRSYIYPGGVVYPAAYPYGYPAGYAYPAAYPGPVVVAG